MQILSIALYSHDGQRRVLPLKPHGLNVISGPSRAGKTEIVKIIDFCCGRDKPQLAPGPITQKVAWFAVLFEGADRRRVLVARPQPTGKSTSKAMLAFGTDLDLPDASQMVANSDSTAARGALNDLIELRDFDPEVFGGNRERLRASVGHAVQFCLQNQNELSSPDHLFHRGSDADVARDFNDLFAFFLGADNPEALARRRRAAELRRQITAAERRLSSAQASLAAGAARDEALVDQAVARRLLVLPAEPVSPRALLHELVDVVPPTSSIDRTDVAPSASELRDRVGELRDQLQLLRERRSGLSSLRAGGAVHTQEIEVQVGRLGLTGELHGDPDAALCPACGQHLPASDVTLNELAADAGVLREQLGRMQSAGQELRAAELELDGMIADVQSQYTAARAAFDEARRLSDAAASLATQEEAGAFLRGVISEHLRQAATVSSAVVNELANTLERLNNQLEIAANGASSRDVIEELEARLEAIAQDMTQWARRLELEGSEDGLVRVDRKTLNVTVSTHGGRVDLAAMGSGANHVGYHLVAHLALHRHFILQNRPVPRFLVLDQPSLPYFPRNVADKDAAQRDVDWAAVREMFVLVDEVVEALSGRLQVLITDHASFAGERWFDKAIVEDWHAGTKLVPDGWPLRPAS